MIQVLQHNTIKAVLLFLAFFIFYSVSADTVDVRRSMVVCEGNKPLPAGSITAEEAALIKTSPETALEVWRRKPCAQLKTWADINAGLTPDKSSSSVSSASSSAQVAKLLKPTAVTASSFREPNAPALAFDGNAETRYESVWSDPQWLRIDLGALYSLGSIGIDWEDSGADSYTIEASTTGSTWATIVTFTGGSFGARTDTLDLRGNYRYLRINFTKRPPESNCGYSIYEIRIISAGSQTTSSSMPASSAANSSTAARVPLAATSITFTQPPQRQDGTALPLAEISHYTIVLEQPGAAGVSSKVPKQSSYVVTAPLPWTVYQGDSVRVFTFDIDGTMSAPSENATE